MSRFAVKSGLTALSRSSAATPVRTCQGAIRIPSITPHLSSSRHFSVSQTLDKLSAWEKKKVKGRKPRSLGRAPTKLELVDPDPTLDDEEEKLMAEWKKQYEVDMTHCYDLMKEKAVLDSLDTGAEKQWIQEERRHHANMMKENEEWNQKVAIIREQDLASSRIAEEESIRSSVAAHLETKAVRQAEVSEFVDKLQAESAQFITLDNLEEKIAEALEAPLVNYDFALDRNGKIVKDKKNMAVLSA